MQLVTPFRDMFDLCLCKSLVYTPSRVATAVCRAELTWEQICNFFHLQYLQNVKRGKDGLGFNLNTFKPATSSDFIGALTPKIQNHPQFKLIRQKEVANFDNDKVISPKFKTIRRLNWLNTIHAMVVEFDSVTKPDSEPQEVLRKLDKIGTSYIAYSTWSSKPEARKWRVVIPYSSNTFKDDHILISETMVYLLSNGNYDIVSSGDLDLTCFQGIRFFYVPNNLCADLIDSNNYSPDRAWFLSKNNGFALDPQQMIEIRIQIFKKGGKVKPFKEARKLMYKEEKIDDGEEDVKESDDGEEDVKKTTEGDNNG